jgi:hypothetical protein
MAETASLMPEPRWALAAQALVDGCIDLPDDEQRIALLSTVCNGLGDELYPAFLRVLWIIGQQGDHAARAAVAQALVHALRTGRLPSGRRGAWGASPAAPSATPHAAGFGSTRSLGPLEYLCAWHAQADPARALPAAQFDSAARSLMELIATSAEARLLYCEKLLGDVDDPMGGALTRGTREALRALATAWAEGVSPADACARFVRALPAARTNSLSLLAAPQRYRTQD